MLLFGTLSLMCLCFYTFVYDSFSPASFPGIVFTNKTFAFFLCNGILAFVLGNSGLMKPTEGRDHRIVNVTGSSGRASCVSAMASSDLSVCEKDESAGVRKEAIVVAEHDEDDEHEEDEMEKLSVEELNRKCEDFIKKMKEGMMMDHALFVG